MQLITRTASIANEPALALSAEEQIVLGEVHIRLPTDTGLFYIFKHDRYPVSESISVKNFHGSRDAWSALQINGVSPTPAMLAVYFRPEDPREDDVLFINMPCSYGVDLTCTVVDTALETETPLRILLHYLPAGVIDLGAIRAKQWLLKRISPLDSIAALEKQVDLLSSLVFALVGKTQLKAPDWYKDFLKGVLAHSAERIQGVEHAIAAMIENKASLRALQGQYNERRAQDGVNCCPECVAPQAEKVA